MDYSDITCSKESLLKAKEQALNCAKRYQAQGRFSIASDFYVEARQIQRQFDASFPDKPNN